MEMENIGMVEAKLPPGFRFHPRDEELVCDYLMNKITLSDQSSLLIEVDLNKCEPWDIPREACVGGKEWYFYSQRDRKYATGLRTNRATASGYWKATGKDRPIFHFHNRNQLVGMRKTLVFYQGRAPKGRKTEWVMHEFRLEGPLSLFKDSSPKEDWVLCRLFCKQKEITTRPNTGNSCYNNTEITASSSSSLPPLMDSYINFDQNQSTLLNDQFQQVPCFSIISQNQTNPSLSNLVRIEPNNKNFTSLFEGIPYNNNSSSNCSNIDPFVACDSKVLKVVLDNIAKMETNGNSFRGQISMGEGSSDSYLSEVADDIAILWNR